MTIAPQCFGRLRKSLAIRSISYYSSYKNSYQAWLSENITIRK